MATPGTYTIDIADLKYALVTADTGTTGPTYGTLKDMAAAAQLTLAHEEGDTRELRGDGGVVQRSVAKGSSTITVTIGGLPPQVIADLWGHVYVTSGTTPNIKNTLTGKDGVTKPYFKIEAQSINNDVGDTHLIIYKAQVDGEGPELSLQDGEFGTVEFTGTAYWTTSTKVVNSVAQTMKWELIQNETAVTIT